MLLVYASSRDSRADDWQRAVARSGVAIARAAGVHDPTFLSAPRGSRTSLDPGIVQRRTKPPAILDFSLASRSGIDPSLLTKTLAVIVWITWAQLVVALAAETIASVRGTVARRVPVLPGLQTAAARLVATIALVAASIGPLRPQPALGIPLAALIAEPTYHSLVIERASWNHPDFVVTAWTDEDEIMGVRHKIWPLHGVQFHPESFLTVEGPKLLANFVRI